MHEEEVDVDETLVRRLLAQRMPDLADQPLAMVEPHDGGDHNPLRTRHDASPSRRRTRPLLVEPVHPGQQECGNWRPASRRSNATQLGAGDMGEAG